MAYSRLRKKERTLVLNCLTKTFFDDSLQNGHLNSGFELSDENLFRRFSPEFLSTIRVSTNHTDLLSAYIIISV